MNKKHNSHLNNGKNSHSKHSNSKKQSTNEIDEQKLLQQLQENINSSSLQEAMKALHLAQQQVEALKAEKNRAEDAVKEANIAMKNISQHNNQYHEQEYWEKRYESEAAGDVKSDNQQGYYEWYLSYDAIRGYINDDMDYIYKQSGNGKSKWDCKVMVAGCGNSSLCEDLAKDGYRSILGVDYSSKAIEIMTKRLSSENKKTITYKQIDLTQIPLKYHAVFHCIVDKGTLDALSTDVDSKSRKINLSLLYLENMWKCLCEEGRLIIISTMTEVIMNIKILGTSFQSHCEYVKTLCTTEGNQVYYYSFRKNKSTANSSSQKTVPSIDDPISSKASVLSSSIQNMMTESAALMKELNAATQKVSSCLDNQKQASSSLEECIATFRTKFPDEKGDVNASSKVSSDLLVDVQLEAEVDTDDPKFVKIQFKFTGREGVMENDFITVHVGYSDLDYTSSVKPKILIQTDDMVEFEYIDNLLSNSEGVNEGTVRIQMKSGGPYYFSYCRSFVVDPVNYLRDQYYLAITSTVNVPICLTKTLVPNVSTSCALVSFVEEVESLGCVIVSIASQLPDDHQPQSFNSLLANVLCAYSVDQDNIVLHFQADVYNQQGKAKGSLRLPFRCCSQCQSIMSTSIRGEIIPSKRSYIDQDVGHTISNRFRIKLPFLCSHARDFVRKSTGTAKGLTSSGSSQMEIYCGFCDNQFMQTTCLVKELPLGSFDNMFSEFLCSEAVSFPMNCTEMMVQEGTCFMGDIYFLVNSQNFMMERIQLAQESCSLAYDVVNSHEYTTFQSSMMGKGAGGMCCLKLHDNKAMYCARCENWLGDFYWSQDDTDTNTDLTDDVTIDDIGCCRLCWSSVRLCYNNVTMKISLEQVVSRIILHACEKQVVSKLAIVPSLDNQSTSPSSGSPQVGIVLRLLTHANLLSEQSRSSAYRVQLNYHRTDSSMVPESQIAIKVSFKVMRDQDTLSSLLSNIKQIPLQLQDFYQIYNVLNSRILWFDESFIASENVSFLFL